MQRSSWILLGICVFIAVTLLTTYHYSTKQTAEMNQAVAFAMVHTMQKDVRDKNVDQLMSFVDPSSMTNIADNTPKRIRKIIAQALAAMHSPRAVVTNMQYSAGTNQVVVEGDLNIEDDGPDYSSSLTSGHLTFYLKPVTTSHMFGLWHTKEWKITRAAWSGQNPDSYGCI